MGDIGSLEVHGPHIGQSFIAIQGVTFGLTLAGTGLASDNRMSLVPGGQHCFGAGQDFRPVAPRPGPIGRLLTRTINIS